MVHPIHRKKAYAMQRLSAYLAPSEPTDEIVTSQETWINLPDMSLGEVYSGMQTQFALECLSEQVKRTTDTTALQCHDWAFKALSQLSAVSPETYPALEDYEDPALKRDTLSEAIEEQAGLLGRGIALAMEDYTDNFGTSLKTIVNSYNESVAKLNMSGVDTPEKPINVDHSKIWALFHVNGKLQEDPNAAIHREDKNLRSLIAHAEKVAGKIDPKKGKDNDELIETAMSAGPKVDLMFNTQVDFVNGKVDFSKLTPPKPAVIKTPKDYVRGAAIGAVVGTFVIVGTIPGALIGGFFSDATGKDTVRERDAEAMFSFLKSVASLNTYKSKLEKIANDLNAKVDKADGDKAAIKRQASLVMELVGEVARHIGEVMYGASVLATAIKKDQA